MHNSIARTSTATSRMAEQSITASLTAEILHDLDDGEPTLVASTQGNQGDLQVVTVNQLLAKAAEQRAQIHRIESLAREWGASQALSPGDEMANRILDASLDRVIAALPEAVDQAMQTALPGEYTPELAARIAEAMTAELRSPQQGEPAGCSAYPGLCTETEPGHYDHSNHQHTVTNKSGGHLLNIGFVQLSDGGPEVVYIGGMNHEDYLPEEVQPITGKLRHLLDEADAIADQLIARREANA